MKELIGLVLGLVVSSNGHAAVPSYNLSSPVVFGQYEQLDTNSCTEEDGRPCLGAEVKMINGTAMIKLADYETEAALSTSADGRLVFKWTNPYEDDCDSPGCWNLLAVNGVIFPKKVGAKYTPALKLFVKKNYPFPDEEGAPEGEVTEVESFIKRK